MTQELGGEPALTMVADTSRMGRLQGTQAPVPWSVCGTYRNSMWKKKKKCPMMLKSKSQLGPIGTKKEFNWDHPEKRGFPGGPVVKNPPTRQETRVQSLGCEDPLGKEMANH